MKGGRSDKELAELAGESKATIHRYICLTNLTPMLLQMVDEGKIAMRPAVELSYLSEQMQDIITDCMLKEDCTPSHYQAIRMRNMFNEGTLTKEIINQIMGELKPNQTNRISLSEDKVKKYIPKDLPLKMREDYIQKALKHYDKYLKRQKEYER